MGKWMGPAYDSELLKKMKILFEAAKQSIREEEEDEDSSSMSFEAFVENFDVEDSSTKKLFELMVRETAGRRKSERYHPYYPYRFSRRRPLRIPIYSYTSSLGNQRDSGELGRLDFSFESSNPLLRRGDGHDDEDDEEDDDDDDEEDDEVGGSENGRAREAEEAEAEEAGNDNGNGGEAQRREAGRDDQPPESQSSSTREWTSRPIQRAFQRRYHFSYSPPPYVTQTVVVSTGLIPELQAVAQESAPSALASGEAGETQTAAAPSDPPAGSGPQAALSLIQRSFAFLDSSVRAAEAAAYGDAESGDRDRDRDRSRDTSSSSASSL